MTIHSLTPHFLLAKPDAIHIALSLPKVERCLFSGPCETGGTTHALDGWLRIANPGLSTAGIA
jgi:hypothetical protein